MPTLLLVSRIFTEMESSEIEFLAEKETIEIIPNFSHATMHLIQAICFKSCSQTIRFVVNKNTLAWWQDSLVHNIYHFFVSFTSFGPYYESPSVRSVS